MANSREIEIAARLAMDLPVSIDRLPGKPALFEEYRSRFEAELGRPCDLEEFWLSLLAARKRGLIGPSRRRRRNHPDPVA